MQAVGLLVASSSGYIQLTSSNRIRDRADGVSFTSLTSNSIVSLFVASVKSRSAVNGRLERHKQLNGLGLLVSLTLSHRNAMQCVKL